LYKANNEAKVRRSTKSVVLDTAKVMSYEDLEEARAKRVVKEAAKETKKAKKEAKKAVAKAKKATKEAAAATGKSTRGSKRKLSAAPKPEPKRRRETEESEPLRNLIAWVSEGRVAPIARMI
jgi:regulator of protease activity HflC (stomatin/prohibitin superfamily)